MDRLQDCAERMSGACLGATVDELMLLAGIDGFSFILTPDGMYVRLKMLDDDDAPACLASEVWFDANAKPDVHRELARAVGDLAPWVEVRGIYDFTITVRSVTVADGLMPGFLGYTKRR